MVEEIVLPPPKAAVRFRSGGFSTLERPAIDT
jgi:hypothetical protein